MSLQFLPLSDIQNVDKIADLIKKYATAKFNMILLNYHLANKSC